jgi:hypothetical protein
MVDFAVEIERFTRSMPLAEIQEAAPLGQGPG